MIDFDYKGIKIVTATEWKPVEYSDPRKGKTSRLEKDIDVAVYFWSFPVSKGDFLRLAFVKSVLQYFMQCYWKRTSEEGGKIQLLKELQYQHEVYGPQSLLFTAKQKNKCHTLDSLAKVYSTI